MAAIYQQKWDLESIFTGGSSAPSLVSELDRLEQEQEALRQHVESLQDPVTPEELERWHRVLEAAQRVTDRLTQVWAFLGCLTAQDVNDTRAKMLMGQVHQLYAGFQAIEIRWKDRILKIPAPSFEQLLADSRFEPVAFALRELRQRAAEQMEPALEMLAADLSVDGYHSWDRLYDTIVGRITIPFQAEDKVERLSVGQAFNKFGDPDPNVRAILFTNWESAWGADAELCAAALNHLGGFRLNLYRHRGWESVLKEPLLENRMSEATLNAMWHAVEKGKERLLPYLKRRAALLGRDGVHWYDDQAPIGRAERKVSYEEAADFIVDQFRRFSPRMAEFAEHAFANRWIEAEDRSGKQPGGFCTSFPETRETRIFMTFGGNTWGVTTLAHELGHAYHAHVMWDLPPLSRMYPTNLAETASTFAEFITAKAAIRQASTEEERIALLDAGIRESVAYLMNIHARFIFEQRFYAERKRGLVSVDRLNDLMLEAQREAYCDGLDTYHPLFWASKGHFYATGAPFYNFPYTFGYLFSAGLYARALEEGPSFEEKYVAILRDTGRMTVEDLARRHLNVDLTQPDYWLDAVNLVLGEVDEFMRLTHKG